MYELDDVKMMNGSEGQIFNSVGEIHIALNRECRSITLVESYHPRWRAFDQNNNEVIVECTEYGFMKITSTNNIEEVHLIYSDTTVDVMGRVISLICLIVYFIMTLSRTPFQVLNTRSKIV